MPDLLSVLAELGILTSSSVWMPVLAWTALALVLDIGLRLVRPSASVGLWVRGALLAVLPALLILPPLLAPWVPSLQPTPTPAHPSRPASLAASTEGMSELAIPAETPLASSAPDVSGVPLVAPPPISTPDVLIGLATVLAVASALVALGVLAGGLLWLLRYRRALDAAAAPVQADAQALAERFGLRRALQVASAEPTSAPFTLGWRRPVVAVPPGLTGERLELALAHEIAHVRHAHFAWHLAEQVLRALFVWNPTVHVLGRGLALDRERIADAAVLRLWPERAERYGRLLLAFASNPSPGLALGASSSPIVHRLTAMTRLRPDRRGLARIAGLAVFALPLLALASAVPDPQPPAAPPSIPATLATQATPDIQVTPPAQATVPATTAIPLDTLREYIDDQRILSNTRRRVRAEIRLKPNTPRHIAVAIADYYSDGNVQGELTVISGSERIRRTSINGVMLPPPPPPPRPSLAHIEDHVERRQVWDNNGDVRVEVTLKPGTSRAIAEDIANYYADGDRGGELVIRADDIQIRRRTLREDAVPPPHRRLHHRRGLRRLRPHHLRLHRSLLPHRQRRPSSATTPCVASPQIAWMPTSRSSRASWWRPNASSTPFEA